MIESLVCARSTPVSTVDDSGCGGPLLVVVERVVAVASAGRVGGDVVSFGSAVGYDAAVSELP